MVCTALDLACLEASGQIPPLPPEAYTPSTLRLLKNPRIALANGQSLLVPHCDHNWMVDPSIIAAMHYICQCFLIAEKKDPKVAWRKYGNIRSETHYVETADLAVNLHITNQYPFNVKAYIALTHDLFEDLGPLIPELTPARFVHATWKGDPKYKPVLIKALSLLTDDKSLKGWDRHREQVRIANTDPTGLVAPVRFPDKLTSLNRDVWTLLSGIIPFGDRERFLTHHYERREVVQGMKGISPRLMRWFDRLMVKADCVIDAMQNGVNLEGARNDFLDPLYSVFPATPELRMTRRTLAALAPQAATL
ncbi:MAG: hypothetical protein PHW63_07185 [Alphaproteobacteria bacterium]|nr:hypothetical protein [Alphaproteobacteria bacterium]